jgi:ABC-2 type transport system ATP-binding protein
MAETLIRVREVTKNFGEVQALAGVSLWVGAGEIYGLVGPDGAGKTTLIRLICGALKLQAGSISLCGFDIVADTERARGQIGYLAQRSAVYEDLTVMENLKFFAEVRGLSKEQWAERCRWLLEFVGLAEFSGRMAGQLSGGMKQKLALAVALIHRPLVLLLDEPTTGVDPLTRLDFWRLLIRLVRDENLTVLLSTPYMDEAARCTRVGFLHKGHLICEGSPRELRSHLIGRVLELIGEPASLLINLAKADQQVEDVQRFGNSLHLRVQEGQAEMVIRRLEEAIVKAGGRVHRLRLVEPLLEDVFIVLSEG